MVYIVWLSSNFKIKANSCFLLANSPTFCQHIHSTLTVFCMLSTSFDCLFVSIPDSSTIAFCLMFPKKKQKNGVLRVVENCMILFFSTLK